MKSISAITDRILHPCGRAMIVILSSECYLTSSYTNLVLKRLTVVHGFRFGHLPRGFVIASTIPQEFWKDHFRETHFSLRKFGTEKII